MCVVRNCLILYDMGNLLTGWGTVSFSRTAACSELDSLSSRQDVQDLSFPCKMSGNLWEKYTFLLTVVSKLDQLFAFLFVSWSWWVYLSQSTDYPGWDILWFSSVSPGKYQDSTFNLAMTLPNICCNLLFNIPSFHTVQSFSCWKYPQTTCLNLETVVKFVCH